MITSNFPIPNFTTRAAVQQCAGPLRQKVSQIAALLFPDGEVVGPPSEIEGGLKFYVTDREKTFEINSCGTETEVIEIDQNY